VNQLDWCELVTQKLGWKTCSRNVSDRGLKAEECPREEAQRRYLLKPGHENAGVCIGGVGFPCSIEHKTLDILTAEFLELIKIQCPGGKL